MSAELEFEDQPWMGDIQSENRLARPPRDITVVVGANEDEIALRIDAKIARLILPKCYELIRDLAAQIDPLPRELQIRMAQLLPKQEK